MTSLDAIVRPASGRSLRLRTHRLALDWATVSSIAVAFVVTRVLVWATVFLSMATLPMRQGGGFLFSNPHNLLLDGLVRYDSWWYRDIVVNGYRAGNVATGEQGTVAFFPLYPLIVKAVSQVIGNVYLSGVLVSNACFLLALIFLYKWARHETDREVAGRFVFYVAAAPTALFFSAMYTESLFLLLVAATFSFAATGHPLRAAVPGILAAATRNTGALLAVVIALEGFSQSGVTFSPGGSPSLFRHLRAQIRPALRAWPAIVAAALVPLGLLAYMGYLAHAFGDPLAFIHAQATWGRDTSSAGFLHIVSTTRQNLRLGDSFLAGQVNSVTLLDLVATLSFLPLVVVAIFKLRPAYGVYAAITFLVPLSTGSVGSMTRYVLMLLPCFFLLAQWGRRPWVDRLVLGSFLPMMAYFAVLFSHWFFAG